MLPFSIKHEVDEFTLSEASQTISDYMILLEDTNPDYKMACMTFNITTRKYKVLMTLNESGLEKEHQAYRKEELRL